VKDCIATSDIIYRPNAIRALCRIIDGTTVQAIERLIKTAIVDKSAPVSSAALVSSYHLFPLAKEVVRRWASEAQDSIISAKPWTTMASNTGFQVNSIGSSPGFMTQYHGLGLLYLMRQQDRMGIIKIVQQFSGGFGQDVGRGGSTITLKSPQAIILLIRFTSKIIQEDPKYFHSSKSLTCSMRVPLHKLLEGWLRHKSDMVNFEAARAICTMENLTDSEASAAIQLLQLFLTSPRFISRFTAIRILQNLASTHAHLVNSLNLDIEALISDSNRSIATYAITTLLKTGNEASVDRLMKEITGFMGNVTDGFKITIVQAIRSLSLKFRSKQGIMLGFLAGALRDEGGFEFKKAVMETIFDMIKFIPDCRDEGIFYQDLSDLSFDASLRVY
jgi:coatomer subunit gamma